MTPTHEKQWRSRVAQLAAQIMAEHGVRDYRLAKRKAVRQLGGNEQTPLPHNDEIDIALKDYLALYDPEVQSEDLQTLRCQALEIMHRLERFDPVLTGGLVSGAISRHSDIELDIRSDESKSFELFLLNAGIPFKTEELPGCSLFRLLTTPAEVLVRFLPSQAQHQRGSGRGKPKRTLTAAQLKALIAQTTLTGDAQIHETDALTYCNKVIA